jgi:hypothetical protein
MVGMIFYDNSNLTVPHNGGSSGQWFLLVKGGTTWAAQVFTDGEVLDYVDCSTLVSQTPTQTSTPTQTPTNNSVANLNITNGSLDIEITSVYVNSVNTSVTGGQLPNTTGNGTNLSTTQIGVYTVEINYNCSVSGQHITLTDSASVSTCQNTSTGSNTMTFTAADVFSYLDVEIDAQDGTC